MKKFIAFCIAVGVFVLGYVVWDEEVVFEDVVYTLGIWLGIVTMLGVCLVPVWVDEELRERVAPWFIRVSLAGLALGLALLATAYVSSTYDMVSISITTK